MSTEAYKHPKWQQKRLRIMDRDGWKCIACGQSEVTLHVHHKAYNGQPWDVDDKFLQTLCEECHQELGPHPKGGIWWERDGGDAYRFICWCPQCACTKFKDKETYVRCCSCGWGTGEIIGSVSFGGSISIVNDTTKKKPKEYSLGWVKGMIQRVRNGGASDTQIFDAIFPGSPALEYAKVLSELRKTIEEQSTTMASKDELELVRQIITARDNILAVITPESVARAATRAD
jgi:hypothetical protein